VIARFRFAGIILAFIFASLTARAQDASFIVRVEGKPAITLTAADLAVMPHHSVTANQHGKQVSYEGVYIRDVLAKEGVPFGSELKGNKLSTYVLATAQDGYAVVYTLTEMNPDFNDGDLLIADKVGGAPNGPFRIIAPHDSKPARSLRMLKSLDVVQLV
jgi:hypothetical protein